MCYGSSKGEVVKFTVPLCSCRSACTGYRVSTFQAPLKLGEMSEMSPTEPHQNIASSERGTEENYVCDGLKTWFSILEESSHIPCLLINFLQPLFLATSSTISLTYFDLITFSPMCSGRSKLKSGVRSAASRTLFLLLCIKRILFFSQPRLHILIFLPILGWKYSSDPF